MNDAHPWTELDDLLEEIKAAAVADDCLPESLALVFHDGRMSAVLATPPFVLEHADLVTDVLCRLLPETFADQIAVVWPARFEEDGDVLYAMKVHLWERSHPERVTCRIVPVPICGAPDGPSVEVVPPDPWSRRLAEALRGSATVVPETLDTRLPDGFDLLVRRDGPLDGLTPVAAQS
jgi:hypothetical protein